MAKTFKDILVWRKAHQGALKIYNLTNNFPKHELFGLTSQIRRAAISVAANIVEGHRRKTIKDGVRFYNISEASLEELKYHILLSKDLEYINEKAHTDILMHLNEIGRLLNGWIKSQNKLK